MIQIVTIPVSPYLQNCTLLIHTETAKAILVDPGGDVPIILAAIRNAGVAVEGIWLTHGHLDHAGGAAELKDKLNVAIDGPHAEDEFLLSSLRDSGEREGMPEARNVVPDRWLEEGDELPFAGTAFGVLRCPGHTPGSIAFINPAMNVAIVGDVLFRGSVGRTDLPRGDMPTLLASIRKLMQLDDRMKVICGHGPFTTIGQERRTNPYCQVAVNEHSQGSVR